MYFNVTSDTPQTGGAYLPYRHWRYLKTPHKKTKDPHSGSHARTDFSSDLIPHPTKPKTASIDHVITHGYLPIPRSDPETALLSDKKQLYSMGLTDVIGQIRRRYEIYEHNLNELAQSQCAATNAFFDLESLIGPVAAASREAQKLNKNLQDLYREERAERIKLWEDVTRLRQTIPEAAQQYLSALRKTQLLETVPGDVP